ncbi:MAG TPA: RNA polymerase sigma factor [Actinomycetota bacterium]
MAIAEMTAFRRPKPRVAARGGTPPFERFLEEQRATVYRFLLGTVGPVDADDVFQDTFLAALRAYPNLRDASNLRGWVLAIATRKAIDLGRSRARRPTPVADPDDAADARTAVAELESGGPDLRDPLWTALRGLPPRQRAAVVHRVVLDRSYAEVAGAMACSQETARANVYQGLKRIREILGD